LEDSRDFSWLPFVLQTNDPLFPTGAYAHSLGLEEMVRLKVVSDEASLRSFLHRQVVPALAQCELPYLRFARAAARASNLEVLCMLDSEISAWKLAQELREASAQLGTRRLKILQQIAPGKLLDDFQKNVAMGKAAGHHLIVCGLQFSETPLPAALATYFYQALAAACSAALKLIRIGQEGCQRVIVACLNDAENAIAQSMTVERSEVGWFNPLLEIASMRHARAGERLFIS
jgi:urease accessory protein